VRDGAVLFHAGEKEVVLHVPEEGEEPRDRDGERVVEARAGIALRVVREEEGAAAAGAVPGRDLAELKGGVREAGFKSGLSDAGAVVPGFAEEGRGRGVGGNVRVRILPGEEGKSAGNALGRGDAAFDRTGFAFLVRFEAGGAADQQGLAGRVGNPAGELCIEAEAVGGGVAVVEGGADGGDGIRPRIGEEAGKAAHRVQLVDGEVHLALAGKKQVGGMGGCGGESGGERDERHDADTKNRDVPENSPGSGPTLESCPPQSASRFNGSSRERPCFADPCIVLRFQVPTVLPISWRIA